MDESKRQLRQEGDVNFSEGREEWYKQLDPQTLEWLNRDAAVFLHQSLSTPCLNVIESCEGIYLTDINGKRYMDFHGNSVHQVGYRNSYVTDRLKSQLGILPFSTRRYTNKVAIELAALGTRLGFNGTVGQPLGEAVDIVVGDHIGRAGGGEERHSDLNAALFDVG